MSKSSYRRSSASYRSAKGKLRYTLLNDCLFKVVFQNRDVLTGFICSLLHLTQEDIRSLQINNPIRIGRKNTEKTFVLDIDVTLNDDTVINLELQVENEGNWPDRSLSYLCRSFDRLAKGENYRLTRRSIHISILDFTLFPEYPEFYASYKLLNEQNLHIYNDKFQLYVLELNQTKLATKTDKAWRLDLWAALFKSTTWEEIKMLAKKNTVFQPVAQELYESLSDYQIRRECEAREEYYRRLRRAERLEEENNSLHKELSSLKEEVKRLQSALEEKNGTI